MELTPEQIEELMAAVIEHETDRKGYAVLYAGHVWTPNGVFMHLYQPWYYLYYDVSYSWELLKEVAEAKGMTAVASFLTVFRQYLFRKRDSN